MFQTLTLAQLQTLRDEVKDAISRSLNAQSYTIGVRSQTRARLPELLKTLSSVEKAIAAKNGDDIGYGTFDRQPDPDPKYRYF